MVQVEYAGGLGNNMFQYGFGRILAGGLGYRLVAPAIEPFGRTSEEVDGDAHIDPVAEYRGCVWPDLDALVRDRSPRRVLINACLQRYSYYRSRAGEMRGWFALPRRPAAGPKDLVLHIRLGDYLGLGWVLDPSYYMEVIERESFERLFIITDAPDHAYHLAFHRFCPIIPRVGAIEALIFLRNSHKLAISQSTFGWWGAFLSDARTIYFPVTDHSIWSAGSGVDLWVNEPRYVLVKAQTWPSRV